MRTASMYDGLSYLISCEVPVDLIVDVGILSCTYPLIKAYPDIKHILVEPVKSFHENIKNIYNSNNIEFELLSFAAGSTNSNLKLCEFDKLKIGKVTHSTLINEDVLPDQDGLISIHDVPVKRIDDYLKSSLVYRKLIQLNRYFLFKIDVDGFEEEIFHGAECVLDRCSIVVLEVPIPKLVQRINLMDKYNFVCVDIVEPCYYKDNLSQVDIIFVKRELYEKNNVNAWIGTTTVDPSLWQAYVD